MKEKILTLSFIILLFLCIPTVINAETTTYTATSTINGVTVNWSYELNDAGQIEKLKCTNPIELTGNITIPSTINGKTVTSIGNEGFKSATNITGVIIQNSIKEIGAYAFADCTKLAKINFGTGIEYLGINAFKNCKSLTSLSIPKSLTRECGNHPFEGCSNISTVIFENGITKIPPFICEGLTGITEITVPNTVKEIGAYAFADCTKLAKINFGTGIEYLSINAFKNCKSLTSLSIPKSLTRECGNHPFEGCSNISTVIFENGITKIPPFICEGLTGITEITVPNTVKEIGAYAFADCTSLKKITILDNVTRIGVNVFKEHNENLTIYCYKDSVAAKYAIDNNIKTSYLTKSQIGANEKDDNKGNNGTNNGTSNSSNQSGSVNNGTGSEKDSTTATGKLPQTGIYSVIAIIVIAVAGIGAFTFRQYRKLKDI